MKIIFKLIRTYFKILSVAMPKRAAKKAFTLFQKPRRFPLKPEEREFYNLAREYSLETSIGEVNYYTQGKPEGELVFLVHGWNSQAGSMAAIGANLVKKGYYVVALDLPAHGKSNLKYLNIISAKVALKEVIKNMAGNRSISLVSHSLGSLISALTLSELNLEVKQLVYLTTPDSATSIFENFKREIGLGDKAYQHLIKAGEDIIKAPLKSIDALELTKSVDYDDLLLIHDKFDRVLPYNNSLTLNEKLSKSSLFIINKVGHSRMLWNESVLQKINETFSFQSAQIMV